MCTLYIAHNSHPCSTSGHHVHARTLCTYNLIAIAGLPDLVCYLLPRPHVATVYCHYIATFNLCGSVPAGLCSFCLPCDHCRQLALHWWRRKTATSFVIPLPSSSSANKVLWSVQCSYLPASFGRAKLPYGHRWWPSLLQCYDMIGSCGCLVE